MKLTSIDELTDEVIGLKGSQQRDKFEYDLQMDVLGDLIKVARKRRHLTQAQLGPKLGVGKAQISKLENNTKDFRIGTIIKVMNALNLRITLRVEDKVDVKQQN